MARDPNQVPLADAFNRADEGPPPGPAWSNGVAAGWQVISNQIGPSGSGFRDAYLTTGVARSNEPGVAFKIPTLPATTDVILAWLFAAGLGTDTPSGYSVRFQRDGDSAGVDSFQLQRWDTGVATFLNGASATLQAGGWIALVTDAGGVEGFYSQDGATWTSIGSSNDTTFTGTLNGGIEGGVGTAHRVDDFGFGAQAAPDTTPPANVADLEVTESQITPSQITAHFHMPADPDTFAHSIRYKMGLAQTFLDETDGLQFTPVIEAPANAEIFASNDNFNPEDQVTVAVFVRDSSGNWNTGATDDITLAPGPSLASYTSDAVSSTSYGAVSDQEQRASWISAQGSGTSFVLELGDSPPLFVSPPEGVVSMLMNIVVSAVVTPERVLVQTNAGLQVAMPNEVIVTTVSGDRLILSRPDFEALAPDAVFDAATKTYVDTTAPGPVTGLVASESPAGTIVANFTMPTGTLNRDVDRYLIRQKAGLAQTFADETNGVEFAPETTAAPGAAIMDSLAGFSAASSHTLGIFAGDGSGNWSAAATDDITLA